MASKILEKPLIILGNPRSGTSLLRLMLTSHSKIVVPPECGFIHWWHNKYKDWNYLNSSDGKIINQFLKDLMTSKKIETWGLNVDLVKKMIMTILPNSYSDLCLCVLKAYSLKNSNSCIYLGDKNNYYIYHIEFLKSLYPNAKFLCIVRDVRDVVCSYDEVNKLNNDLEYKPNLKNNEIDITNSWYKVNKEMLANTKKLPNWYLVKYEDILTNTKYTLQNICDFLDLEYDKSMLSYYKLSREPEKMMAWKMKTKEKPDKTRIGRYKEELSKEVQEKIIRVSGDLMKELKYKL